MLNTFKEYDNVKESHQCELCDQILSDREILLLDNLVECVEKIHPDEKLSLFYIAGYVASKHEEVCGSDEVFEEVKEFLDILDRGNLSYPTVPFYDFVLLAYVFFSKTLDATAKSLPASYKSTVWRRILCKSYVWYIVCSVMMKDIRLFLNLVVY